MISHPDAIARSAFENTRAPQMSTRCERLMDGVMLVSLMAIRLRERGFNLGPADVDAMHDEARRFVRGEASPEETGVHFITVKEYNRRAKALKKKRKALGV